MTATALDVRARGRVRFEELGGFPTPDQEAWRYTSFKSLAQAQFVPVTPGPVPPLEQWLLPEAYRLLFVDGRLVTSDLRVDQPTVEDEATDNPFVALNQASLGEGARLSITQVLERPLQLLFVNTRREQPYSIHPRIELYLARHSQATVLETYVGEGTYFTNPVLDVRLDDGAALTHCKQQLESTQAWHVGTIRAHLGRDAQFGSTILSLGGRLVRQDTSVVLEGAGASCRLNGLAVANGRQHVDNATFIDHAVPHCTSHELYKTMLDDEATAGFTGRILVRPDAQKTDAHQSNRTLLLSPKATMSTRPQLQIYADDVKCTHGAAVGQLDENAVFYLLSRGIDQRTARALLGYAFGSEVVEGIALPAVQAAARSTLRERLALPAGDGL